MLYSIIKKGVFQDSVSLMLLSKKLTELPGIDKISIMMGTQANKNIFENTGLINEEIKCAGTSDLCIAIDADREDLIPEVVKKIDIFLADQSIKRKSSVFPQAKSLQGALSQLKDANIALISISGKYAAREAKKALNAGLNVFIFSDNVSIEDELSLKQTAHEKNLLVMGPDCGTGTINGTPLAFSNINNSGNIGIIGASGTGIQAVLSGIDYFGEGISHAIGLGGRDLSSMIGGISGIDAIDMLVADAKTDVIVFISKPPAKNIRNKILERLKEQPKPVVTIFLGENNEGSDEHIEFATTLIQAAEKAVKLARKAKVNRIKEKFNIKQTQIHGLYCGGTLASEASFLLAKTFNIEFNGSHDEGVMFANNGHSIIDLGDDVYTVGRAHPMIDPTTRNDLIIKTAIKPETAVIILDVIIGFGAHADPAQQVVETIEKARDLRKSTDGEVVFIASICGTKQDHQNIIKSEAILRAAGVIVIPDNSGVVNLAIAMISKQHNQIKKSTEFNSFDLLKSPPKIINIGLVSFAEDLFSVGAEVVQLNWQPPAGGNEELIKILDRLS